MLSAPDIIVLLLSVVGSLGIGLLLAYRAKTYSFLDYFLGGRRLHYIPVALSLTVTFESSILVLGYPAEVYIYGISHLIVIVGIIPCIAIASAIALPVFYKMKLTSVYDYVTNRFAGKSVVILRVYFVFLGVLFTVIYMSIVLLGPAFVFEALLGVPLWVSIIGSAVIATVYTSLGGIRAVVWTDAFQLIVMVSGLLAILIKVIMVVGGVQNMIDINREYGRMNLFDFNPDPRVRHTFWALSIGSFSRVFSLVFSQMTVQRFNSTSSISNGRKALLIFVLLHCVVHALADVCGLAAFAYYAHVGCDPLESGAIKNPNQILVALVSDLFTTVPGIAGLIIAAVISASLSTLSSGYNGLAAITSEELFRHRFKDFDERKRTTVAKLMVPVYGLISSAIALAMMVIKGSFSQIFISVLGALGAPTSGMFLVALLYKRVTARSVLAGGVAGLLVSLWISIGYNFSSSLPSTPWLQPGPTDTCELLPTSTEVDVGNSSHLSVGQFNVDDPTYTSTTPLSVGKTDVGSISHLSVGPTVRPTVSQTVGPTDVEGVNQTYTNATHLSVDQTDVGSANQESANATHPRFVHPTENNPKNGYGVFDNSAPNNVTENGQTQVVESNSVVGLDHLYSVSYLYFSVICTLVTILTTVLVNVCISVCGKRSATVVENGASKDYHGKTKHVTQDGMHETAAEDTLL